jgi:hypothetical protein
VEGPYEDLPEGELPERQGVGENTGGPSMSFSPKIISILSRFYSDFIQIISRFFQTFSKAHFTHILHI